MVFSAVAAEGVAAALSTVAEVLATGSTGLLESIAILF